MVENGTLIIVLSGDYRLKEVAYALVPAIRRPVLDLAGNVEKVISFTLQPLSIYFDEDSMGADPG
ncbi:hypothetical protein BGW80DRAFT_860774 [Lactifluus volemus]|jgi:hypothetical protein|nr:hypothetical protein BGW80DRAFT_860774 [Lactifluus volemus]